MPLFLFTRPREDESVEDASTAALSEQATFPLTELPNEILVSFSWHSLFINSIYFKTKILGYVSFEDLYSLERVSKRWRDLVLKSGWPMKDTLSFEAITEYSDYPNFKDSEKQDDEVLEWKTRHKVSNKSVSVYFLECLFNESLDPNVFISNQCQTYRFASLQSPTFGY